MVTDANPTARALRALQALQDSPGLTAQHLGDRLGVTDRAARRYVAVLREAGLPVESERGPYGGYRLGRGVRVSPLLFSTSEALGLVMAVLDGHHDPADDRDPVGSALGKLLRALPEPVARQADEVRRATAPARDRAAARPDPETAATLVRASSAHQRVRLEYRSEAGSEWTLEADPLAVVVRHGRWYLLCWSHRAGARRAYRVDRVGSVDLLPESFTPPDDLDPVAELEEHLAVGWEHEVRVLIDAPSSDVARCVPRALGRLEPLSDLTCALVGSTSNPAWYATQLTLIPAPFRVEGGAEIRAATETLARRLTDATRAHPDDPPPSPG